MKKQAPAGKRERERDRTRAVIRQRERETERKRAFRGKDQGLLAVGLESTAAC